MPKVNKKTLRAGPVALIDRPVPIYAYVFTKLRGFKPWPSQVIEIMEGKQPTKYKVFWFGTNQTSVVFRSAIIEIIDTRTAIDNKTAQTYIDDAKFYSAWQSFLVVTGSMQIQKKIPDVEVKEAKQSDRKHKSNTLEQQQKFPMAPVTAKTKDESPVVKVATISMTITRKFKIDNVDGAVAVIKSSSNRECTVGIKLK